MSDKLKIFVTGATGFVGCTIIEKLRNFASYETFGLCRGRAGSCLESEQKQKKKFYADITDPQTLREVGESAKADVFIHTAGLAHQFRKLDNGDFWRVNVHGTENVCKLAQQIGAKHFILMSSVAVYGGYERIEVDETFVCNPKGFYAKSKLESESRAMEICEKSGIRLTILRLATVIGENDPGNTSRLITAIDKGRFIWIGDGGNKKSLIYKDDIAEGILRLIQNRDNIENEVYNLTGEAITMKEIVEEIAGDLGRPAPRLVVPQSLVRMFFKLNDKTVSLEFFKKFEETFKKWRSDDMFSGRKFNEKFDFSPRTPIREGLARQVKYYLNKKS